MSSLDHYQQNDNNYEAITRMLNTSSLFQCPICKTDFKDPRILCSNGHTFCLACIQVSLQGLLDRFFHLCYFLRSI